MSAPGPIESCGQTLGMSAHRGRPDMKPTGRHFGVPKRTSRHLRYGPGIILVGPTWFLEAGKRRKRRSFYQLNRTPTFMAWLSVPLAISPS